MASGWQPAAFDGQPASHGVEHSLGLPGSQPSGGNATRGALDRLLEEAAQRISRFAPEEAFSASAAGGVIIDIRSQDARDLHGLIPGSLHVPRTVLEWRVAVDSPWRNPYLAGLDQQLILICDHGYSSILAAGNLVQLGFARAGDVIGGFEAWKHHGLPIAPSAPRSSIAGALPGTGSPAPVDDAGLEPATSALSRRRSPS